jgi:hypothetical protein
MDRDDFKSLDEEGQARHLELAEEFAWELLDTFGLKWGDYALRITKDFGGWPECLFNLKIFKARVNINTEEPSQVSCPPDDHYYPRFQVLLNNKVITQIGPDLYEFRPLPGQVLAKAAHDGPATYDVSSFTDEKVSYSVNVKDWICTCQAWKDRHHKAEIGHPARLCKHLLRQVAEHPELMTRRMEPYGLIMTDRFRHGQGMPVAEAAYGEYEGASYIIQPGEDGWIDFLIGGDRYGYNPSEKKWTRDEKPDISRHLLAQVKKLGLKPLAGGRPDEGEEPKRKRPAQEEAPPRRYGYLIGLALLVILLASLLGQCSGQ